MQFPRGHGSFVPLVSFMVLPALVGFATVREVGAQGPTTRVSVATGGGQSNGYSRHVAISHDGRYVLFDSTATNLVPDDTNSASDSFVHDRVTGATERVSVADDEGQAAASSYGAGISDDGRYVAFTSAAANLVVGDTNASLDVFVRDRQTGTTTRVSVATGGAEPNGHSQAAGISADGRHVVFESFASNLVPNDANGTCDVFVHDRQSGVTSRVSTSTTGVEANQPSFYATIDATGRYVAFCSQADNLAGDQNPWIWDVFVHDRQTAVTTRVSRTSTGAEPNGDSCPGVLAGTGTMPGDAGAVRYVAFGSEASDLVCSKAPCPDTNSAYDVFVHDRSSGAIRRVSVAPGSVQGDGHSFQPSISRNARWVAFGSYATNLVPGDTNAGADVFVADHFNIGKPGSVTRVNVSSSGEQAESPGGEQWVAISGNGRYVLFTSYATNLVPGDTNDEADVFVRDRGPWLEPPDVLTVGGTNVLHGANFTAGSRIWLYVSTSQGPVDVRPAGLAPSTWTPTALTWDIPPDVTLGQGFASVRVVNTDMDFFASSLADALLVGDANDQIPTITAVNGVPLSPADPSTPVAFANAVVGQGLVMFITGTGFGVDTRSTGGPCAPPVGLNRCPTVVLYTPTGSWVLDPEPGGSSTALQVVVPAGAPTGPASLVVVNSASGYQVSNAVSVVLGARVSITGVTVVGQMVMVTGTGFCSQSVINLYNLQPGGVANLGGFTGGAASIPLNVISHTQFTFALPPGAVPGPAFIEVLNPPFLSFSSTGNDPDGAFTIPPPSSGPVPITFGGLSGNGTPFSTYQESGFTVSPVSGNWEVSTTYGHPAPFIRFVRPAGQPTVSAEVRVTDGGAAFTFSTVDLYSSVTPIPYLITGFRNSATVFTVSGTVPNTYGNFAIVSNPHATIPVDALVIKEWNPETPSCPTCSNPVGLDNIVVGR